MPVQTNFQQPAQPLV
jgi:hypothetical protein